MFLRHNESHFQREINNTLSLFIYLNFLHSFLFFFSNTEKKKINCVKSSAKKNKFDVTQWIIISLGAFLLRDADDIE